MVIKSVFGCFFEIIWNLSLNICPWLFFVACILILVLISSLYSKKCLWILKYVVFHFINVNLISDFVLFWFLISWVRLFDVWSYYLPYHVCWKQLVGYLQKHFRLWILFFEIDAIDSFSLYFFFGIPSHPHQGKKSRP